jgi:thiol-disulfide isomerase/thioredoxin
MKNLKAAVLIGGLLCLVTLVPAAPVLQGPAKLPEMNLPDLNGKMHSSAEFAGKVVVTDFWATWCATCKETIPKLAEIQNAYKEKGLVVLGISVDKGSDHKIARTGERLGINYLVLRDKDNQWAGPFGFKGIPSVYVFGRDGNLVVGLPGYNADQEKLLAEAISKAVNAPSGKSQGSR